MEQALLGLIDKVEMARIGLLRRTLATELARKVFRDRALRLLFLFSLAVIFYLPLSLYFPLWILAVGPLIWGLPHILSSFRFQHYTFAKFKKSRGNAQTTLFFMSLVWGGLSLFRIYTDVFQQLSDWEVLHPGIVETAVSGFILVGLCYLYQNNFLKTVLAALLLVPFTLLLWRLPLMVSGVLILAHNFIAFVYWIAATRSRRDRFIAILATCIFALIHFLMFAKFFDPLINLFPGANFLNWSSFSIDDLGHSIFPWSQDPSLWYRSVCLYAFGQSLHYFVWLKAIPDVHAPSEVPTNFKTAWNFLKRDSSVSFAMIAGVLSLAPVFIWVFVNYDWAHRFYFALASSHGFIEIAGLGLLLVSSKKSEAP